MSNLFDYNKNLYPDRYDRSKGWVKVLPIPGRNLQTAELTEIQSIQQDNLKQGFNSLFKNGTILSGLQISIFSSTDTTTIVSISSGQMYVEGIVIDVPSTSIEVSPVGLFNIGVVISESIITEEQDPSLRDPIKGDYSYGTEGAARLNWQPTIVVNDTNSFVIGQIIDSSVIQSTPDPFYLVNQLLSTYTYERAGNFCVRGFDASYIPSSQRIVSDQSQYTKIQNAYSEAQNKASEYLSTAITAKSASDNINAQLNEAISNYNITPIPSNQLIVSNLTEQKKAADIFYAQTATASVTQQSLLQTAQKNLEASKALLVDKVIIAIAPGLAYVGGKRIESTSPTLITIPKDLPTTEVTAATFTYAGRKGTLSRIIFLTGASSFLQVQQDSTSFIISVSNLVYGNQPLDITIQVDLENISVSDITSFINLVLSELNKTSDQSPDPSVSIKGTQPLSSIQLRSILKSQIVVTRTSLNNLIFTSTAALEIANQITISTQFYKTDTSGAILNGSSLISADVSTSNIYGASQNTNFQLGFTPVAEVIEVIATLEEVSHPIVRGTIPGTQDVLNSNSVERIEYIKQGTKLYLEGTDYQVIKQSQIDWSIGTNEPDPGTTYYVSFLYKQSLTQDKDFTLDKATSEIKFGIGLTPATNQEFSVSYSYYLALAGAITLDSKGSFNSVLSLPSSDPIPPSIPSNLLSIATFQLYADRTIVKSTECRTVNFESLFELEKEIKANTADIQTLSLNSSAYSKAFKLLGEDPIGMFNDSFQDRSKLDIKSLSFTGAISPSVQGITAGYTHKDIAIRPDPSSTSTLSTNYLNKDSFITLPYTQYTLIKQSRATESIDLITKPKVSKVRGRMHLSYQTSFLNTNLQNLTVCDPLSSNLSALSRLTSTDSSVVIKGISKTVKSLFKATSDQITNSFYKGNALSNTNTSSKDLLSTAINSVKSSTNKITILVENLTPNTDGYLIYFSGALIPGSEILTQDTTSPSISIPNAVRSDALGKIKLSFSIPEGVKPGVHLIEAISEEGYAKARLSIFNNLLNQVVLGAMSNWGFLTNRISANEFIPIEHADYTDSPEVISSAYITSYQPSNNNNNPNCQIINPSTQFAINENKNTISRQYPSTHSALNQTIQFPDFYYITSITLYLKQIPTLGDIKVYLKEATSLYPTKTIYGIAIANSYSTSSDGTSPTIFTFTNPVLVNPNNTYSISVESTKANYKLFTATIGQKDLATSSLVGDQLYLQGSLVMSNDGINLDTKENTDLTFSIQAASFPTSSLNTVGLGTYGTADGLSSVSHFCLNTRDIVLPSTSINYQYSTNQDNYQRWSPFSANLPLCLSNQVSNIKIRAVLNSTNKSKSPLLSLEGSSISLYTSNPTSSTISTKVIYPSYTNLDIIVQYVLPANTNITVFYSPTNGYTWEGPEWIPVPKNNQTINLIDPALSLFEATYSLRDLNPYYALSLARTKFRYRIDTLTSDAALQPLIKQVISYVW